MSYSIDLMIQNTLKGSNLISSVILSLWKKHFLMRFNQLKPSKQTIIIGIGSKNSVGMINILHKEFTQDP